ncbi:MAG TPA: hypothetical protein VNC78_08660 [Actinomycetota bacterium]|nr:hypothetical protein [Actinomycetota bacterium]
MPPPLPPTHREKSCNAKKRYATGKAAKEMAAHRRSESGETDLEAYPCAFCGGWHIGHAMSPRPSRL